MSGPQFSAGHGMLNSQVSNGTVQTLLEVSKRLARVKAQAVQRMVIHPHEPFDTLAIVAWGGASWANRHDGSSTAGICVGCAPQRFLSGEETDVPAVGWRSGRIHWVCRSAPTAEVRAMGDAVALRAGRPRGGAYAAAHLTSPRLGQH